MKQRSTIDSYFMKMAISQAVRGERTSPNPKVGCVLVKDGNVIATGYHSEAGKPHAEVIALEKAGHNSEGCTAYVTLEPCAHQGKTPPCAPRLVREGIKRAVFGCFDPDPRVSGKGADILIKGGVDVTSGILQEECKWINRGFIRRNTLGRPWVTLKTAISIDGKMALSSGKSKWITGYKSRRYAHLLRGSHDALMVGAGTCRSDDPSLTLRYTSGVEPLKVIIDPCLSISSDTAVYKKGKGFIITDTDTVAPWPGDLSDIPFKVIRLNRGKDGFFDPGEILRFLLSKGINSVMVEGGAKVASQMLSCGLVDEVSLFISPGIIGKGLCFSDYISIETMDDTIHLRNVRISRAGNDIWVEGMPECSPDL